jgi:hypothetical protein
MNSVNLCLNTICLLFLAWRIFLDCFFIILIMLDIRCHKSTYSSALLSASSLCNWKIIYSLMSLFAQNWSKRNHLSWTFVCFTCIVNLFVNYHTLFLRTFRTNNLKSLQTSWWTLYWSTISIIRSHLIFKC